MYNTDGCILFQYHMMFVTCNSNTTCVTSGAGTANHVRASDFTPFLWNSYCSIVSFLCSYLYIIICSFVIFILVYALSVLLRITASDYPPLVSCVHCVACSSLTYCFWLPFWYLVFIVLPVLLWLTASDYPFGILCSLCRLFFFDLLLLITLWYLVFIVLPVLLWLTASDYPFGILCSLCYLFFFHLLLLIILLVSCGHCVACSSLTYCFWLPPPPLGIFKPFLLAILMKISMLHVH
jgi:hypothetical protein